MLIDSEKMKNISTNGLVVYNKIFKKRDFLDSKTKFEKTE